MKIIHLSDLHFHRNNSDNKKANATLKNINTKYPKHYIVITGDIVDDGHEKQYENAYNALKKFQDRVFIVPGNHDYGAIGNFFSEERATRFDNMLSTPLGQGGTFSAENKPVVNVVKDGSDSAMFIGLDSNLETEHPFDFACGEVGDTQLNSLSALLANPTVPEMKKVLFFHHHPFVRDDPFMALKDASQLARVIYNKVDIMLFGHKHVVGKWGNRWCIENVHASDDSPGKSKACEITIKDSEVKMKYIDI